MKPGQTNLLCKIKAHFLRTSTMNPSRIGDQYQPKKVIFHSILRLQKIDIIHDRKQSY